MPDEAMLRANAERFMREVFNEHNVDTFRELVADDSVDHQQMASGGDGTKESSVGLIEGLLSSFPDLTCEVEEISVSGDRIAIRSVMRGTNTGPLAFPGMPPLPATGKSMQMGDMDIMRANEQGQMVEHWGVADAMGMMTQLGLMPAPE